MACEHHSSWLVRASVTGFFLFLVSLLGEGNGSPLRYSYLENAVDRGAWQATVHGAVRVGHDLVTTPPPPPPPSLLLNGTRAFKSSHNENISKSWFSFLILIYLAKLDPSCSMWLLLVLCRTLSVATCGIQLPDQGSNPGSRHWEHRALATGPPGKSLIFSFKNKT